ncbi:hypothetical protein D3C75_1020200 [compost metagenome]
MTGAAAATAWGTSAVKGLSGYGKAELIRPNANTNLLHPRTVLPALTASLEPGIHWLASAVFGDPSGGSLLYRAGDVLEQSPGSMLNVVFEKRAITIITSSGRELILNKE